MTVSVLSQG